MLSFFLYGDFVKKVEWLCLQKCVQEVPERTYFFIFRIFDFPKSKILPQVDSKFLIFIPVYFFSFRISLLLHLIFVYFC
ncbi:MAG: hypothetical protein A3H98_08875 [Bacteroidetes bacterium RIFCSPLOWO2_02_FULL_36_8]|nr:MAG: hypothetical protein A3H98_08875 [Bacteroidetes bacterium RIFCSPLOWO2_02_FULL_36_8]OFY69075.1 MAG: hypothetical protein A3G23_05845 [Bacteroidetes bacterium RIFCSPLOWO2_12_FULL_37_12]